MMLKKATIKIVIGVSPYNKSGTINGVWSPDWTGTGTVVIV